MKIVADELQEFDWDKFEFAVGRALDGDPDKEINVDRLLAAVGKQEVGGLPPCTDCYGPTEFIWPPSVYELRSIVVINPETGLEEPSWVPLQGTNYRCRTCNIDYVYE